MAEIQARTPFYITQTVTTLTVQLFIWEQGGTAPVTPQYTITKSSYEDGISEELKVDISPMIRDYFDHVLSGSSLQDWELLNVKANVNGVDETHTAIDGYEASSNSIYYNEYPYWKNIISNNEFKFYYKDSAFPTVSTLYSNGESFLASPPPTTSGYRIHTIPAKQGIQWVKVTINSSPQFTYYFRYDAPYECEVYNIAFINKSGVWEWLMMPGAKEETLSTNSKEFVSMSDFNTKVYNKNGKYQLRLNTGWLPSEADEMIESLMLSEKIILDAVTNVELILKDKTKKIQNNRNDKMINYEFVFELGKEVITDDVTRVPDFVQVYSYIDTPPATPEITEIV